MSDPFDWHRRALAGEKPPIHDGKPQVGFFRAHTTVATGDPRALWKKMWLPGSIFLTEDGKIRAEVDGTEIDPINYWTRFADHPVSEDDYRFRVEHGHWPDEPPPPGHNAPPESSDDPEFDRLLAQVEEQRQAALVAYELHPDAPVFVANRAMHVVEKCRDLAKRFDELRKARKQPHLDAERAIDAYFREPIQELRDIADMLAPEIVDWKKAEEERRREAAEAENRRLAESGEAGVEPERVMLGGGVSGRRSGGRKVVTAKIVDQDQVYAHFREHDDVRECLQRLANAAIKKAPVPGAEKVTEEVI